MKEFLLITQCDLLNAADDCFGLLQVQIFGNKYIYSKFEIRLLNAYILFTFINFLIFQLSDHDETVMHTKSISIRFYVHLQTNLAKQVRECQDVIKVKIILYRMSTQFYSIKHI